MMTAPIKDDSLFIALGDKKFGLKAPICGSFGSELSTHAHIGHGETAFRNTIAQLCDVDGSTARRKWHIGAGYVATVVSCSRG